MSSTGAQPATGKLLQEFPPVGYADWRKIVDADLKGAPFEKRMLSSTYEGIQLRPIYRREDIAALPHTESFPGFAPFVRGTSPDGYVKQPWDISQEILASSPAEFNTLARASIERGLTALNMVLDHATRDGHDPDWAQGEQVGAGGLSVATREDLEKALDGIDLEKTRLLVRCGPSGMPFAAFLAGVVRQRKKSTAGLKGCIETDPLGVLSHEGRLPQSLNGAYREMAALTGWAAQQAPGLQTICVHSRAWHDSGASAVQELAFALATGVEYLRQMDNRGLPVDTTAPRLRFALSVGVNFFMEIAKIRAMRMLWSRAVAAAGGNAEAQKLSLHIRTSRWNKTVYDPYNNLLRTTVEAFAGVLGGCDSMQVGAFDEVIRTPDDFSQRIARNTQLILQKECQLTDVIDPAGGSWFIENLTAELASRAWALFQEVEKIGGMEAALRAGFPQKSVAGIAADKIKAVSRRRDSIVGVNQYANPGEKTLPVTAANTAAFHRRRMQQVASYRTSKEDEQSVDVLKRLEKVVESADPSLFDMCIEAALSGATLGEITRAIRIKDTPGQPIVPVCMTRAAAGVEELRAAMDRYSQNTGKRPKAFLCNMGPLKEHKARADFSRGFLAVGGYEVVSPAGFKNLEAAVEGFRAADTRIAVVCSTDENYPALVPPLVKALRAVRPDALILLAGYPPEQVEALKSAGVDEFIHIRADVLETLKKIHSTLGIA